MNRHLIVIGVVIILLAIGLSGCIGGTSIKDINEHPNNYLNKELTIQAFYGGAMMGVGSIYQKKWLSDEMEAGLTLQYKEGVESSIPLPFG